MEAENVTENVRVDKITLDKVREFVKKTGQKIGKFYDLAAEEKLASEQKDLSPTPTK